MRESAARSPERAVHGVAAVPATVAACDAWAGAIDCRKDCVAVDGDGQGYQRHRLSAGVCRIQVRDWFRANAALIQNSDIQLRMTRPY